MREPLINIGIVLDFNPSFSLLTKSPYFLQISLILSSLLGLIINPMFIFGPFFLAKKKPNSRIPEFQNLSRIPELFQNYSRIPELFQNSDN